jgi:hypothetical protein
MDIRPDEIDMHGTGSASNWYSSKGLNKDGRGVVLNFFADTEEEVHALAHGLGIVHDVSMHERAIFIGTRQDYEEIDS